MNVANLPAHGIIAPMFERRLTDTVFHALQHHSVVALLGPRQVGKTTLATSIAERLGAQYLDLEDDEDRGKLADPKLYLRHHAGRLVVLDEIQRVPELFSTLRGLVDAGRRSGHGNGQYLILGSASAALLRQSSESLAGRIRYLEMTPVGVLEAPSVADDTLWLRGGFPRSLSATSDSTSMDWRESFLRSYVERDILQFNPRLPTETLLRFWKMLAHLQGSPMNAARLASALGVSGQSVGRYLDLFCDLLLVRRLAPWSTNSGKRLVRTPKVYVRDSGLLHALLNIRNAEDLAGHPVLGASWESFVVESLIQVAPPGTDAFFYRSARGAEIDLLLTLPGSRVAAFEIKRSLTPKLERGFFEACADIEPRDRFVVYPGSERYPVTPEVEAISLRDAVKWVAGLVEP